MSTKNGKFCHVHLMLMNVHCCLFIDLEKLLECRTIQSSSATAACVITVTVEKKIGLNSVRTGVLTFVECPGSERVTKVSCLWKMW